MKKPSIDLARTSGSSPPKETKKETARQRAAREHKSAILAFAARTGRLPMLTAFLFALFAVGCGEVAAPDPTEPTTPGVTYCRAADGLAEFSGTKYIDEIYSNTNPNTSLDSDPGNFIVKHTFASGIGGWSYVSPAVPPELNGTTCTAEVVAQVTIHQDPGEPTYTVYATSTWTASVSQ